jgi:hypothetical protein
MDAGAWRIRDTVVEACGLVAQAEGPRPSAALGHELQHVRGVLAVLAREAEDDDMADAACGVLADVDRALERLDRRFRTRAA